MTTKSHPSIKKNIDIYKRQTIHRGDSLLAVSVCFHFASPVTKNKESWLHFNVINMVLIKHP